MDITAQDIADIKVIRPRKHGDARGFFSEIYASKTLRAAGITDAFVQDNYSLSVKVGTIRGLHFQLPPAEQAKLVFVLSGRILDIAVDCRKGSPTFGRHHSVELSAERWNQIYLPAGFAHGFCTLEPNTGVLYKVSAPYAPQLDSGILWNDPDLGIAWPVAPDEAVISDKDRNLPRIRDLGDHFMMAS